MWYGLWVQTDPQIRSLMEGLWDSERVFSARGGGNAVPKERQRWNRGVGVKSKGWELYDEQRWEGRKAGQEKPMRKKSESFAGWTRRSATCGKRERGTHEPVPKHCAGRKTPSGSRCSGEGRGEHAG